MKVYEGARSLDGGIVIVAGKPLPSSPAAGAEQIGRVAGASENPIT